MSESNDSGNASNDTPDSPGDNDINDGEGLEIADPNDFFHRRDSDDELQPVVQKIPGRGQALRVIPPTTGDYEKYNLDDEEALFADNALLAELFNEKFPDLDEVTAEDVRDGMIAFGAEPLVDCIRRAGGQDMKDAMEEQEIQRMMQLMGEQGMDFQDLVELGEEAEEGTL